MLSLAAETGLITLPVAKCALMINMGNQPTVTPCLHVIPSSLDPGTGWHDRSRILRDNRSLRVRTLNADNAFSFDHLQRECAIIPPAVRGEKLLPIRGTVRQDS